MIEPKSTDEAKHELESALIVTLSSWRVIFGATLSAKVMFCVAEVIFPEVSLAVHVTIVVPVRKVSGASFLYVKEQLSAIVGTPKTITQVF